MDAASAFVGLASLASLAARSTTDLITLIGALKDVPQKLHRQLRWLTQLTLLLAETQDFCADSSALVAPKRLELLRSYVKDCKDTIQDLSQHIEGQITSLNDGGSTKRHVTRL